METSWQREIYSTGKPAEKNRQNDCCWLVTSRDAWVTDKRANGDAGGRPADGMFRAGEAGHSSTGGGGWGGQPLGPTHCTPTARPTGPLAVSGTARGTWRRVCLPRPERRAFWSGKVPAGGVLGREGLPAWRDSLSCPNDVGSSPTRKPSSSDGLNCAESRTRKDSHIETARSETLSR